MKPCSCYSKTSCHAYCIAVRVIQTQRIYCKDCNEHFMLNLTMQNVSIVSSVVRYVFIVLIVILLGICISFLDAYLKCRAEGADGKRTFTSR